MLKVIPVEEKKSRPYLVMEYLDGQTLADLLKETSPCPKPSGRDCQPDLRRAGLPARRRWSTAISNPRTSCSAATAACASWISGSPSRKGPRRLTFVGFTPTMGTPDYMAPEQVKGKRGDHRTDIYSLGAILYEMATGSTLFEGESPYVMMNARVTGDPVAPRKVNPKLTPVLEEIILHAMERNPASRFPSAAAMKAELEDYEKVPLTERWRRLQPPQIWRTRYRLVPFIAGVLLLNIGLFFLLWWYLSSSKGHGH